MPLQKKWSHFYWEIISREGDQYGVYELGYRKKVVYIGEGLVRKRLEAHWNNIEHKPNITWYRCKYTGSKERAERVERVEMKKYVDDIPYYGHCTQEYVEGIEEGIEWLKQQILKP